MLVLHESLKNKPKCRVELHVHLDGSIRPETAWELLRKKGLPLPGDGSLSDLKDALIVKEPKDLMQFLTPFGIFIPAIVGDLDAIERISREFVEDQAKMSIAYSEARFCPHFLVPNNPVPNFLDKENGETLSPKMSEKEMTADDVLDAVLRGLATGQEIHGTKVRVILCCIIGKSEWSWDILRLCEEYRDKGVVGIDVAGDESSCNFIDPPKDGDDVEIKVFQAAKEKGIHRTVHAGEAGPPESVARAVSLLGAERIGHGYRVIENQEIYEKCKSEGIHFEVCPHSSYLTGAIKQLKMPSSRHPILKFAEDRVSFSISTDDPLVTGTNIEDEYKLLMSWGFTEAHITRANFEAVLHSFLPFEEKEELLSTIKASLGVIDDLPKPPKPLPLPKVISTPYKPSVTIANWNDRY